MMFNFGNVPTSKSKSVFFITEVISTNDSDRFILSNGKLYLLMLQHVTLLSPGSSQRCANLL